MQEGRRRHLVAALTDASPQLGQVGEVAFELVTVRSGAGGADDQTRIAGLDLFEPAAEPFPFVQVKEPEPENVGHVGGLSCSPAGSDITDPFDPPPQPHKKSQQAAQAAQAARPAAQHGASPKLSAAASAALSKRGAQKRRREAGPAPKFAVSATGERLELVPDQRGLGAKLYRVVEPAVKQPKKKKQKRQVPLIDLTSPSPSPPTAAPAEPEAQGDE